MWQRGESTALGKATVSSIGSPLGEFHIAVSDEQIVGSALGRLERFLEDLGIRGYETQMLDRHAKGSLTSQAMTQVEEYFAGRRREFRLCLQLQYGTEFGRTVLAEVAHQVTFGETATYGEIAGRCGKPGAARAVGNIMSGCPFSLLVPCHRVVHAARWGPKGRPTSWDRVKTWLLAFEERPSAGQIRV